MVDGKDTVTLSKKPPGRGGLRLFRLFLLSDGPEVGDTFRSDNLGSLHEG